MTGATTDKIYALDLSIEEWTKLLTEMGDKPFRADQITQWLWQKHTYDAKEMTNLPKQLRDKLGEQIDFGLPNLVKEQKSTDGTKKFLWRFSDGQTAESVLMKHRTRLTACVSTQVGCPLQCVFCATGLSGYVRNLSAGEIAAQFLAMEKAIGRDIGNVVYMGMGEPFLNTDNVLKSIRLLSDAKMRNIGIRHFTISTSGILPGIIALARSGLGVRLAVSLHAADDDLRGQLMPINQKYPVAELRKTMEEYQKITGDRITIEYALLGGINDSVDNARALVRYIKGLHVFINLIPFNAVDDRFKKTSAEAVLKFRKVLETAGFEAELRHEYGADIEAACGQLRRKTNAGALCRLESRTDFNPDTIPTGQMAVIAPKPGKNAEKSARKESKVETKIAKAGKRPITTDKSRGDKRQQHETDKSFSKERSGKKDSVRQYEKNSEKRRKTGEQPKERYRSGKMKEERPSHKGRGGESSPQREAQWYDEMTAPRRPKSKKTASPSAKKTSMTGAERKKKPAYKPKAAKKKK